VKLKLIYIFKMHNINIHIYYKYHLSYILLLLKNCEIYRIKKRKTLNYTETTQNTIQIFLKTHRI